MIGWETTPGRDAGEAIDNGLMDADLDRLAGAISTRRAAIAYGTCPACGEPLTRPHVHDGVRIERDGSEPRIDFARSLAETLFGDPSPDDIARVSKLLGSAQEAARAVRRGIR